MTRILDALSNIQNVKVTNSFDGCEFDISDKKPIITVGFSKVGVEKSVIDGGSALVAPTLYFGVFTHKNGGMIESQTLSAQVIQALMPVCESISATRPTYVTSLRRFRCEIVLNLNREIFKLP